MRKRLALIGAVAALSFTSCNLVCERAGNRINNFTRRSDVMAEPATTVKPRVKDDAADQSVLKDVKPQRLEKKPEYSSKPDFVFTNGDKFYEDKKLGLGRVIRPDGDLVIEGRVVKNDGKGNVEIETNPQDKKYDIKFRPDGFRITVPHLLKD